MERSESSTMTEQAINADAPGTAQAALARPPGRDTDASIAPPGIGSILEMISSKLRHPLGECPPESDDCFYGNPLGFLGEDAPRLQREQFARQLGKKMTWPHLCSIGTVVESSSTNFLSLCASVDRKTASLWALFEYLSYVGHPDQPGSLARLLAVASTEGAMRPGLSMRFAKAVWMGYYHACVAMMSALAIDWDAVAEEAFPWLVDENAEHSKPISRWTRDRLRWPGFVDQHADRPLRITDDRLVVRQMTSLVRPARAHGRRIRKDSVERMLSSPIVPGMRLLKDGHKGTGTHPSELAHLIAACGADSLLTAALRERNPWECLQDANGPRADVQPVA